MKVFILPWKAPADILFTPGDNLGCCCFNTSSVLGNETELYILIFSVLDSRQKRWRFLNWIFKSISWIQPALNFRFVSVIFYFLAFSIFSGDLLYIYISSFCTVFSQYMNMYLTLLHLNNLHIYPICMERLSCGGDGGGGELDHTKTKPSVFLSSIYNIIYAMYYSIQMIFPWQLTM